MFRRARRVRVHLVQDGLPSVEGLLQRRTRTEYLIAVPQLDHHPEAKPLPLDCRYLAVPKANVAFYEVLS